MSTKLISALALAASLMFSGAAYAGQAYDPSTGLPVTTMEAGSCALGQTEGNKTCVCSRTFWSGRYKNCRMEIVAAPTPRVMTSLDSCVVVTLQLWGGYSNLRAQAYDYCMQSGNIPYGYDSGGYYGYGGTTYTPAYQCSGRPNDSRCGQKPADVAHSPYRW